MNHKIKAGAVFAFVSVLGFNIAGGSPDESRKTASLFALLKPSPAEQELLESRSEFAFSSIDKPALWTYSVLSKINVAGNLAVCIQFKGYERVEQKQKAAVEEVIGLAVNAWNRELYGVHSAHWKHARVAVRFPNSATPRAKCPLASNWIRVIIDKSVKRSFANMRLARASLSGDFMMDEAHYVEQDGSRSQAFRLFAHEYGHLIGLGDTYTESGYQQPIGQSAGIMNNLWNVKGLTYDDQIAVRQLWTYMNTKVNVCGPDYESGGALENTHNNHFCVPRVYRLTNMWQGAAKSLDIIKNSRDSVPQMAKTENYSGQTWYLQRTQNRDYYQLRTNLTGSSKCLDIINDGFNNRLTMADCGNYSGQYWKFEAKGGGYFRLKTLFTGETKCLDVLNDGTGSRLHMTDCGFDSGQYWLRKAL